MKLVSFEKDGAAQFGFVDRDEVVVITDADWSGPRTLGGVLADGSFESLKKKAATSSSRLPLASLHYLPPVFDPPRIFCIGINYEEHRKETGRDRPAAPIIFIRVPQSQSGHGIDIAVPKVSPKMDYEGEIAIVIGKAGRDISKEDAMSHVAGYSAYNDISIRDWQMHTQQWTPGKNFDDVGSFGPWLVTPEEMPASPSEIHLTTRLNGQVMQEAFASDMIFSIPEQIAYISTFTKLLPGDVIATGTPGGVGVKRSPPVYMKAGDIVEIEVTGVGILSNKIV